MDRSIPILEVGGGGNEEAIDVAVGFYSNLVRTWLLDG